MKKILLSLFFGIFIISLVFAQGEITGRQQLQKNISLGERKFSSEQQVEIVSQFKNKIKTGNYQINGNQLKIQEKENNKIQLQVRNISAHSRLNITGEFDPIQNKTRLNVKLSNGRNAEIKIMPNVASETALKRLRLNVCNESNNCSIELKEVGKGNKTKLGYEINIQKHARFLGLFNIRMKVQSQIDAENGEVIQTKKPWWAFLVSEGEE